MITRGIETVSYGMQALLDFEDVTAHNLANVTTNGFKKSNITFQDIMSAKVQAKNAQGKTKDVGTLSNGVRTDRTYVDFSQGGLQETGYKLDLALQGKGFFKIRYQYVKDDNIENKKIKITRDRLTQDKLEMNRMDIEQDLLVSETGNIELNSAGYRTNLQKIQVCDFEDKTNVSQIGQGKYLPIYGKDAGLHTLKDGEYSIQQGMLELSNANTISEMLNTINVSRGYETMSTMLKTQSDTLSRAISLGNISG